MNVLFTANDQVRPKKILDLKDWAYVLVQGNISGGGNVWINHSQEEMLAVLQSLGGITFSTGSPLLGIPISLSLGNSITAFWWKGEMWAISDALPASLHLEVSIVKSCDGKCGGGCSKNNPELEQQEL